MIDIRAVLKYPGAKWNLAEKICELVPKHHTYIEPYFGSGAVFFTKSPSNIEMINDMDNDVTNLFRCIQRDPEQLARVVMTTPYSRQVYDDTYKVDVIDTLEGVDTYHKAAKFLVRCWQGHGFRTNGYKVGWKNDVQGREKMYALWNWYRLPTWIIEIAERLRQVQIENVDATDFIKRFDYENVFMYLDPPYLLGTRTAKQYKHEMTDENHEELLKVLLQSKAKIMISGYESDLYNKYLNDWNKINFNATAEYGLKRVETIWMNYSNEITLFDLVK